MICFFITLATTYCDNEIQEVALKTAFCKLGTKLLMMLITRKMTVITIMNVPFKNNFSKMHKSEAGFEECDNLT